MGRLQTLKLSGIMTATLALMNPLQAQTAPTLPLDDFLAPATPWTRTATGAGDTAPSLVAVCDAGLGLAVPGGARNTYHWINTNPQNSVSAFALGQGRLSVAQGSGAFGRTLIGYGGFTPWECNPTAGRNLALNLEPYNRLRVAFAGVEDSVTVAVTYFTTAPKNPQNPQFYAVTTLSKSSVNGGALEVKVPMHDDPGFNWRQVDGIAVQVIGTGTRPRSYTLSKLEFVFEDPR
jgi:hypothetical protein